jgi:ribonuclease HI
MKPRYQRRKPRRLPDQPSGASSSSVTITKPDGTTTTTVDIWTDGACNGNPGLGGWGAVLRHGTTTKEIYGSESGSTTNNRMELMAPIQALETLTRPATVRIHTDSTYVRNGITQWMAKWKTNGWRATSKQPVKNIDLWQRLEAAANRHEVQWLWVKGHAGDPDNERADQLACRGAREAAGFAFSGSEAGGRITNDGGSTGACNPGQSTRLAFGFTTPIR